jgi:hypothetical protein
VFLHCLSLISCFRILFLALIDPLCEKAIREKILEKFPRHAILGEEAVAPGVDAAIAALEEKLSVPGWLWIVDPVRDVLAVCTLVHLSSSLRHLH